MEIARGSIVLAAGPGDDGGKPRPFLVVQSDLFNTAHGSVTLCPLGSRVGRSPLFRVPLEAGADTGLREDSEIQVDRIQTLRRERLVRVVGSVPATAIELVDQALRRWLEL